MNNIRVVICEPGKTARMTWIENTLEAFQKAVGGYIAVLYLGNGMLIVCNEEGKINNLPRCRLIVDNDGEYIHAIFGTFVICSEDSEGFDSLSIEQTAKLEKADSIRIIQLY